MIDWLFLMDSTILLYSLFIPNTGFHIMILYDIILIIMYYNNMVMMTHF